VKNLKPNKYAQQSLRFLIAQNISESFLGLLIQQIPEVVLKDPSEISNLVGLNLQRSGRVEGLVHKYL
jgi:hypothetical protein